MNATTENSKPIQIHVDPIVLSNNKWDNTDEPAVLVIRGDYVLVAYEAKVDGPVTMRQGKGLVKSRLGASAWLESDAPVLVKTNRDDQTYTDLRDISDVDMIHVENYDPGCG
jgi:hypothetical protein